MRPGNLSLMLLLLFVASALAQPQVYHFKQLEPFLPEGDFGAYKRGKPTGETSSMMGFATSWAQVIYRADTDTSRSTISVKITDMLSIPSYMYVASDVDKETETGYEKTVLYNGIRVLETYDSTSEEGKLQLPVENRFLVEVTGTGMKSTTLLYNLLDRLNLQALEKLGQKPQ